MWAILGIEPTTDVSAIRRAYAQALRQTNPDEDPAGFAQLRQAYEIALARARKASAAPAVAVVTAPAVPGSVPLPPLVSGPSVAVLPSAAPDAPVVTAPAVPRQVTPTAPALHSAGVSTPSAPTASAPVDTAPALAASDGESPAAAAHDAPDSAAPDSAPSDLDQLRAAFVSLQKALAVPEIPDPDTLRSLLETCLQSPALENLTLQIEFESALVRVLLQYQARVGPLLETVIQRWSWRERGRAVGAGISTLIAQADDARHLGQVRLSFPRTYSALTQKPGDLSLWAQIVLYRLDTSVREVMAQWRSLAPSAADPEALTWWRRFFERPHLRPTLIRTTGVLAALGILFGVFEGFDAGQAINHAFTAGVLGMLLGVCATVLWLGLIDWPRYLLANRRRAAPRWVRIGWAPAALAACVVASVCPNTFAVTVGAIISSVVFLAWAIMVAPDLGHPSQEWLLQQVWSVISRNIAIVIWWLLVAKDPADAPTWPMWATFAGTLLALAVGQPLLWQEYRSSLSFMSRQLARLSIIAAALAALALLVYVSIDPQWDRLLLAGLAVIALVQRTAAANLTVAQIKVRYYVTVIPAILIAEQFSHEQLASRLRIGGVLFMVGVVLSMATCLYNELLAKQQAARSAA
jgi:hypothetical protein